MKEYTLIDLFAGSGGFSLAFNKFDNFKPIFALDISKDSQEIVKLNHPEIKFLQKDILHVDIKTIPKHNILCAGFPCQPFSIAGKREGFDDERSNVFWKLLDIMKYHCPEVIILENVKNLKSHDKTRTYKIIEEELTKLGYFIKSSILDTSKLTRIPHHRERIYIVGFRDKTLYDKFTFNFKTMINQNISDFIEENVDKKYFYTDKFKCYDLIKNNVVKDIYTNTVYQFRRVYVRENKSNVCPTLTANMGTGGHNVPLILTNKGIRKLTPRECFNLQGFPQNFKLKSKILSDSKLYKLAGNAISIDIVELIAKKLNSLLE